MSSKSVAVRPEKKTSEYNYLYLLNLYMKTFFSRSKIEYFISKI